ncbi:hypothetical protein PIROE2DRAFT_5140 [Piromyces sp. E2]|nr:hypothetical protein PIROE2DRAFT_5140 [Piromyces sp. E2]|eukprot:OUM67394.1 hypothetical protein PIROE2DRAFT_5140 [Piromyces sp. E2]
MRTYSFFSIVILLLFAVNSQAGILDKIISYKDNIINLITDKNIKSNIYAGGSNSNYLDVYYDKDDINNKKEVVIHIHGGAWIAGSKNQNSKIGSLLQSEGYVAVLPNYVLYPQGKIEEMVNDVYQSILWTYNNISKYGGDNKKIILSGHSAGAHLIALTVIKSFLKMENLNNKYLSPLPELKKLVLFNGPYDFDDYDALAQFLKKSNVDNGIVETFITKVFSSDDVSPTDILRTLKSNSITSFGVPVMTFFYCDKDKMVRESSANNFIDELRRVSPNTIVKYIFNEGNNFEHSTLIDGARSDIRS